MKTKNDGKLDQVLQTLVLAKGPLYVEYIAAACGITETSYTCPITRRYIRQLIANGYVIGSSPGGYKMLYTAKEVQQYLNSLLRRQLGISKRIQAVYDAAQKMGILD